MEVSDKVTANSDGKTGLNIKNHVSRLTQDNGLMHLNARIEAIYNRHPYFFESSLFDGEPDPIEYALSTLETSQLESFFSLLEQLTFQQIKSRFDSLDKLFLHTDVGLIQSENHLDSSLKKLAEHLTSHRGLLIEDGRVDEELQVNSLIDAVGNQVLDYSRLPKSKIQKMIDVMGRNPVLEAILAADPLRRKYVDFLIRLFEDPTEFGGGTCDQNLGKYGTLIDTVVELLRELSFEYREIDLLSRVGELFVLRQTGSRFERNTDSFGGFTALRDLLVHIAMEKELETFSKIHTMLERQSGLSDLVRNLKEDEVARWKGTWHLYVDCFNLGAEKEVEEIRLVYETYLSNFTQFRQSFLMHLGSRIRDRYGLADVEFRDPIATSVSDTLTLGFYEFNDKFTHVYYKGEQVFELGYRPRIAVKILYQLHRHGKESVRQSDLIQMIYEQCLSDFERGRATRKPKPPGDKTLRDFAFGQSEVTKKLIGKNRFIKTVMTDAGEQYHRAHVLIDPTFDPLRK